MPPEPPRTGWIAGMLDLAEFCAVAFIISVLACVTIGACCILRPISFLLDRNNAKAKRNIP